MNKKESIANQDKLKSCLKSFAGSLVPESPDVEMNKTTGSLSNFKQRGSLMNRFNTVVHGKSESPSSKSTVNFKDNFQISQKGKSQPTPYENPIMIGGKSKEDQFKKDLFNHMGVGLSQMAKSKHSTDWIDQQIDKHRNACEEDKELKYNVNFLTSLKLFSRQITDWITKIAKIDYDKIAELVSEFDEANEISSPSIPETRRQLTKNQSLMSTLSR